MPLPAIRAIICAAILDASEDPDSQASLLKLIEDLVACGADTPSEDVVRRTRRLLHNQLKGIDLRVLDPFCGGGSTLVEAQRLELESEGSDLNPIPVLITQALASIPRRNLGRKPLTNSSLVEGNDDLCGFTSDIKHYAQRVSTYASRLLSDLYPAAPNGDTPIYWWWAHTVPSPDPAFKHCRTPLVTSWWLSLKTGEEKFLVPEPNPSTGEIAFRVESSGAPDIALKDRCVFSKAPLTYEYVREQAQAGQLGRILLAFVSDGPHGRKYWPPQPDHIRAGNMPGPEDLPVVPIPPDGLGISVLNYSVRHWSGLFLPRQQRMLLAFATAIRELPAWVQADGGDTQYGRDIASFLGLCLGKLTQASSTIVRINVRNGMTAKAEPAFARGDIQLNWDFAETNPFGGSVGDWNQVVKTALRAYALLSPTADAEVFKCDVRESGSKYPGKYLVVTDPPYFSAIGYADLSGYFYFWMRQALKDIVPELFATIEVPFSTELISSPQRHGGRKQAATYFVKGFEEALSHLGTVCHPEFPMVVIYAQQQKAQPSDKGASTGWEAMLEAICRARLSISGTWPVWGARSARMRSIDSNSLASYIVLVCRPKPMGLSVVTRREFISALNKDLPTALKRLREASVAPIDLAHASLGPGMSIFSNYDTVVEPWGEPLSVRDVLSLIIETTERLESEQEADVDAETRWAVAWFEYAGFAAQEYGKAEQLSKSKNVEIEHMVATGLVSSKGGKVRLLRPAELETAFPADIQKLTVWEVTHRLVRALEKGGEIETAEFATTLPDRVQAARDLAYKLYRICDRRKQSPEALSYNALVESWPEIMRLARKGSVPHARQAAMFAQE